MRMKILKEEKSVFSESEPFYMPKTIEQVLKESHKIYLFHQLKSIDNSLANMYYGGLYVLEDNLNPERCVLCAHSFRELMEKLPNFVDLPSFAEGPSLMDKVRELEAVWEAYLENKNSHLKRLLTKLEAFFEWLKQNRPKRKEEVRKLLNKLDPYKLGLPKKIEDLRIREWLEIREFFNNVAHHRRKTEKVEFYQWLNAFDRILLDYFKPKTFEEMNEIEEIVKEIETEDE